MTKALFYKNSNLPQEHLDFKLQNNYSGKSSSELTFYTMYAKSLYQRELDAANSALAISKHMEERANIVIRDLPRGITLDGMQCRAGETNVALQYLNAATSNSRLDMRGYISTNIDQGSGALLVRGFAEKFFQRINLAYTNDAYFYVEKITDNHFRYSCILNIYASGYIDENGLAHGVEAITDNTLAQAHITLDITAKGADKYLENLSQGKSPFTNVDYTISSLGLKFTDQRNFAAICKLYVEPLATSIINGRYLDSQTVVMLDGIYYLYRNELDSAPDTLTGQQLLILAYKDSYTARMILQNNQLTAKLAAITPQAANLFKQLGVVHARDILARKQCQLRATQFNYTLANSIATAIMDPEAKIDDEKLQQISRILAAELVDPDDTQLTGAQLLALVWSSEAHALTILQSPRLRAKLVIYRQADAQIFTKLKTRYPTSAITALCEQTIDIYANGIITSLAKDSDHNFAMEFILNNKYTAEQIIFHLESANVYDKLLDNPKHLAALAQQGIKLVNKNLNQPTWYQRLWRKAVGWAFNLVGSNYHTEKSDYIILPTSSVALVTESETVQSLFLDRKVRDQGYERIDVMQAFIQDPVRYADQVKNDEALLKFLIANCNGNAAKDQLIEFVIKTNLQALHIFCGLLLTDKAVKHGYINNKYIDQVINLLKVNIEQDGVIELAMALYLELPEFREKFVLTNKIREIILDPIVKLETELLIDLHLLSLQDAAVDLDIPAELRPLNKYSVTQLAKLCKLLPDEHRNAEYRAIVANDDCVATIRGASIDHQIAFLLASRSAGDAGSRIPFVDTMLHECSVENLVQLFLHHQRAQRFILSNDSLLHNILYRANPLEIVQMLRAIEHRQFPKLQFYTKLKLFLITHADLSYDLLHNQQMLQAIFAYYKTDKVQIAELCNTKEFATALLKLYALDDEQVTEFIHDLEFDVFSDLIKHTESKALLYALSNIGLYDRILAGGAELQQLISQKILAGFNAGDITKNELIDWLLNCSQVLIGNFNPWISNILSLEQRLDIVTDYAAATKQATSASTARIYEQLLPDLAELPFDKLLMFIDKANSELKAVIGDHLIAPGEALLNINAVATANLAKLMIKLPQLMLQEDLRADVVVSRLVRDASLENLLELVRLEPRYRAILIRAPHIDALQNRITVFSRTISKYDTYSDVPKTEISRLLHLAVQFNNHDFDARLIRRYLNTGADYLPIIKLCNAEQYRILTNRIPDLKTLLRTVRYKPNLIKAINDQQIAKDLLNDPVALFALLEVATDDSLLNLVLAERWLKNILIKDDVAFQRLILKIPLAQVRAILQHYSLNKQFTTEKFKTKLLRELPNSLDGQVIIMRLLTKNQLELTDDELLHTVNHLSVANREQIANEPQLANIFKRFNALLSDERYCENLLMSLDDGTFDPQIFNHRQLWNTIEQSTKLRKLVLNIVLIYDEAHNTLLIGNPRQVSMSTKAMLPITNAREFYANVQKIYETSKFFGNLEHNPELNQQIQVFEKFNPKFVTLLDKAAKEVPDFKRALSTSSAAGIIESGLDMKLNKSPSSLRTANFTKYFDSKHKASSKTDTAADSKHRMLLFGVDSRSELEDDTDGLENDAQPDPSGDLSH